MTGGREKYVRGAMTGGREKYVLASSPSLTLKLCSKRAYMILPTPKEGSITLGMISSTCTVFWYLFTATISLDRETVESPREREASPDSSSASILVISSRLRAANFSVTAFASFLKALPRGPLFGTISVTSFVTGSGSFFSAQSRTPVALLC